MCVPIQPIWDLDGTSRVAPCVFVSATDINNENSFTIFPNPAKDALSIVFAGPPAKNMKAFLYDYTGRKIMEFNIAAKQYNLNVNTEKITGGMYFFEYNDEAAQKIIIAK
jgi:hypothetical protein